MVLKLKEQTDLYYGFKYSIDTLSMDFLLCHQFFSFFLSLFDQVVIDKLIWL